MDKQIVEHSHSGILLNNTKGSTIDTYSSMAESQMHYAKWKKPNSKVRIVLFLWYSGKGKMKKRSIVADQS